MIANNMHVIEFYWRAYNRAVNAYNRKGSRCKVQPQFRAWESFRIHGGSTNLMRLFYGEDF